MRDGGGWRQTPRFWVRLFWAVVLLALFVFMAGLVRAHRIGSLAADAVGDVFLLAVTYAWAPACFAIGPQGHQRTRQMLAPALAAGVVASVVVNVAVNLLAVHHPAAAPGRFQVQPTQAHGASGRILLGVLGVAVAPMAENGFFFGLPVYLLRRARRAAWLGWPLGVAGVALFTLAHGPTALMAPFYGGVGLLIALTYWRRGYWASVCLHGAFNGAALYLLPLLAR